MVASRFTLVPALVIVLSTTACARRIAPLVERESAAVALTGGPNTSMVYLARTSVGVIAIDLGWWGSRDAVKGALRDLGADANDVTDVFLTHSHRDHMGAWRLLRQSRFHVSLAEKPQLFGEEEFEGWIPRLADRLKPSGVPKPNDVSAHVFAGDTVFVFGTDTLRAYVVPGHTAGSAVYLFRGVLFLGDAATYTPWGGYASARRGYSDDARVAATNLAALWARLPAGVEYVCTAHARCAAYSVRLAVRLGAPSIR